MKKVEPEEQTVVDDLFDETAGADDTAQPADAAPDAGLEPHRDGVLIALKVVTVAFVIALAGVVVILTTSGGEPGPRTPAVPAIADSTTAGAQPLPTSQVKIVAPAVGSHSTQIVVTTTTTTTTTQLTTTPPADQFVRVGEACETRGAYAFTEDFEPVVCDSRRGGDKLVWRPAFR